MPIRPDMVGLVVHDLERSLAFYRLLGLEPKAPEKGEGYVEVITPNGYRISWNTVAMVKGIDPTWTEPHGHRMELAFRCDDPDEVNATYASVLAAGHIGHKEPWDAFWGQRYAVVNDPDGNHVSLFAPLPTST